MNYGALRTHLQRLVNRTDFPDDLADLFLDQGIRKLERTLRVPTMERVVDYAGDGATSDFQIPNDLLEVMELRYGGARLRRVPGGDERPPLVGAPREFFRYGNLFRVWPTPPPGGVLSILYWAEFEAFGSDASETAESASYPDAILYAALIYAADHFVDERLPAWQAQYNTIVGEIMASTEREEMAGRDARLGNPYEGAY